jgi:hypothetical protein
MKTPLIPIGNFHRFLARRQRTKVRGCSDVLATDRTGAPIHEILSEHERHLAEGMIETVETPLGLRATHDGLLPLPANWETLNWETP